MLVLGATGGVGSIAVAILAARGYEVHAATGKADEADFLRALGASEVLSREETSAESDRPMDKQRWAAVVDPVGGAATAYALRTTRYGGAVALSGLTGGTDLATTVFPFILRSVSLLGIDSVETPARRAARGLGAPRAPTCARTASRTRSRASSRSTTSTRSSTRCWPGRRRGRTVVRVGG